VTSLVFPNAEPVAYSNSIARRSDTSQGAEEDEERLVGSWHASMAATAIVVLQLSCATQAGM